MMMSIHWSWQGAAGGAAPGVAVILVFVSTFVWERWMRHKR
jgi:hypothetical protein